MKTQSLNSLSEFNKIIDGLAKANQSLKAQLGLRFRGQKDANWALTTTLERRVQHPYSAATYFDEVRTIAADFNAASGRQFVPQNFPELRFEYTLVQPCNISYFQYLRHVSFPSPLLDWTRCPSVALYFAFATVCDADAHARGKFVSVFVLDADIPSTGMLSEARIIHLSPSAMGHSRQHAQKSCYTAAIQQGADVLPFFVSHINANSNDRFSRYLLPSSLRNDVLIELRGMGIDRRTLYDPEDVLASKLAQNVFP